MCQALLGIGVMFLSKNVLTQFHCEGKRLDKVRSTMHTLASGDCQEIGKKGNREQPVDM